MLGNRKKNGDGKDCPLNTTASGVGSNSSKKSSGSSVFVQERRLFKNKKIRQSVAADVVTSHS